MTTRDDLRAVRRLGLAASLLYCLVPYLWFASTSFQAPVEITATPPTFWPSGTLDAYRSALVDHDLLGYVANSAIVGTLTTVIALAIAAPAAYALARLRVRGRRALLGAILAAAMFPQVAIAGPMWQTLRAGGLLDSRLGVVVPHTALALPLAMWLLASFFHELPADLEEAARIDGCTRLGALRHVVMPLAAPGIFTVAILVFILSWNEFFFALLVLSDPALQTLPLGIALFAGQYTMPWGEIAAASVIATAPLLLVVLWLQRWIVHGLVAGARR